MSPAHAPVPDLPGLDDLTSPIDGYIRVSRVGDRSGASYISPDIQRQALERWAAARNIQLMLHEPEENVSGGTMDRPIFNRILQRVHDGDSGGIAVYKLDRFARTLVGGLTTLKDLADRGSLFASVSEPMYDMTTADGRMVIQFNLMMAEYFRERTTETWEEALTFAVGRGVHISPGLPYGYSKDDGKRLVPNEAAPFAHRAFEMRADGLSFQRIADWLSQYAPPRPDSHRWTHANVERMLRRRVYLGVAFWGQVENRHAHPPLVGDELWHAAQRRVQAYSKKRQAPDAALLHGIVRCAGCRFQMSRALNTSGGRRRQYYRCRVHRVSGTCAAPASVRADADDGLEAYIEQVVCDELDRRAHTFSSTHDTHDLATAIAELEAATADLEDLRQDTTAKRRLGTRWLSFLEPYLQAHETAQTRANELRAIHRTPIAGLTAHAYSTRSRSERTEILRAMIDTVFVRSAGGPRGPQAIPLDYRRVRILWRGQGPSDLPSSNQASTTVSWPWPEDEA